MKDGIYWAEKLRKKEISFPELLALFTDRAAKLDPEINGFVTMMDQAALRDYQNQTDLLSRPFAGLPIPLKMLGQEKAGWISSSGSKLLADHRSSKTSNFTKQLMASGLMPFAQTNSPEFGFKNITDSQLYGPAKSPWNLDHYSGGSSGGAASVVAAGIVPMAAGSDGGGSIRIPASFCGLIGLKPSRGTMPIGPNSWRGWQGAAIDFALTVSMRDTERLFYAMRGVNSGAPYQVPAAEWRHQEAATKEPLKIAVVTNSPLNSPISADAQQAVTEACDFLSNQGHQVEPIVYPLDVRQLAESYYLMNGAETAAMMADLERMYRRRIVKDDVELMAWGLYQYGKVIPASRYIETLWQWDQAAIKMERLFSEYDLLLSPTTATTAPKLTDDLQSPEIRTRLANAEGMSEAELQILIQEMFEKGLQLTPYTFLANLTGHPAISLPTHLAANQLPLGIQFVAARGREDLLLEVGKLMEAGGKFHLPSAYQSRIS